MSDLLYCSYISIFSVIFAQAFFYQGLEKFNILYLVNFIIRFLSLPFIYFLVKSEHDISIAIAIQSLALLLSAIISFYLIFNLKLIVWVKVPIRKIINLLFRSFPFFLTNSSLGYYSNSALFVFGFIAEPKELGYFAAAFGLIKSIQAFTAPLYLILFPKFSHLFVKTKKRAIELLNRVLFIQALAGIFLCSFLLFFSSLIINLLFSGKFDDSEFIFKILLPYFFISGFNNLIGSQVLICLNRHKNYIKIIFAFLGINFILVGIFGHFMGSSGASIGLTLSEFLLLITLILFLKKHEKDIYASLLKNFIRI
jgi:O-antigen/teichoic acid export membrane protein